MNGLMKLQDVIGELEVARQERPSEITATPQGRVAVVQWVGTSPSPEWVTAYVNSLVAADLVAPFPASTDPAVRAQNVERLEAWRRAIGGLPIEGLQAARQYFERGGAIPDGRWRLRPADVSAWVRKRAERHRGELACEKHPEEWRHSCFKCREDRRARAASPETVRRIREAMARGEFDD